MTSGLLSMNKGAIALAADSAVTINGKKVRNGVEKLFKLSNDPPMGMLIFGNANFDFIPMETLIKQYSKKADFKNLKNISEIQKDFLKYLGDVTPPFDFKKAIEENLDEYTLELNKKFDNIGKDEFDSIINEFENDDSLNFLTSLKEWDLIDFKDLIPDFVKVGDKEVVLHVLKMNFFKKIIPSSTGVVIAGFNDDDLFPSFVSFDLIINNGGKIEIKLLESKINYPLGYIVPFAQRDVIDTFLTGSNIMFKEIISFYLLQFFEDYCNLIEDAILNNNSIDELSKKECISEIKKINSVNDVTVNQFANFFEKWENIIMIPILSAINTLPKIELAEMSYSLVYITSLRRKIDSDIESVGGEIAVAIITKGDGFIWVNKVNNMDVGLNHYVINRC